MTRRKFVTLAGSALVLANLPFAERIARAAAKKQSWGGITPNSDFYVTSFKDTPAVNANLWKLKIGGLVENPLELSYDQIRKLPQINERLTLECIGNPPDGDAIGNADWTGPRLRPLLERARVKANAVHAAMRAADGYYTAVPVDEIMRAENFLPYLMNGAPLPPDHGYPLRIFIPGKYGMKQPKWITEIEFLDHDFIGYWEKSGWSRSAWRKPNSGFFTPRPYHSFLSVFSGTAELNGPADLIGWALAGPSGIRRVEVSTDDGKTWNDAEIVHGDSKYVWTVWKYHFAPQAPGKYLARIRAIDGSGAAQPPEDRNTYAGQSAQPRMTLDVTL